MPRAARGVSYGGDTLCVARPEGVSFVLLMTPSAARLALSPAAPFALFAKQRIERCVVNKDTFNDCACVRSIV